jgi:hypothetical protein
MLTKEYIVELLGKLKFNEWMTLLIGVSTIVVAIVNCYYIAKQTNIYKQQAKYEKQEHQPVFIIEIKQEQDSDDGKYGTDRLYIRNVGARVRSPFKVKTSLFFRLTHSVKDQRSAIRVKVSDYFGLSRKGYGNGNIIYEAHSAGNNRAYCELYNQSLADSRRGDEYYFLDKDLLIEISYTDLYNESHTLYFNDDMEITKTEYDSFFNSDDDTKYNGVSNLYQLDYTSLKDLLLKSK